MAGYVLVFSAQTFGQQVSGGFIPAHQKAARVLEDDSSDRFHSPFDQLERTWPKSALPDEPTHDSSAGTVSVDQLRHPLSGKGERLIENGQKFAKAGDHEKAIDEFRQALNEPTSMPYAHSLLGVEYLKTGNPEAAAIQLSESVRLMPGVAANYSNLGCAYILMGKRNAAEHELREAIRLDHISPQPRYLLGLMLLDQGAREAAEFLTFAQKFFNKARLAMAVFHARLGQIEAAEQDVRDYLGPEWTTRGAGVKEWIVAVAAMDRPSYLFGFPPNR